MKFFTGIEATIRRAANRFGLDVTRYRPQSTELGRLRAMLSHHQVDMVLDVGANAGQFANGIRRVGYSGQIISYEPLAEPHALLMEASKQDPAWHVAERVVVGRAPGVVEMKVAGNSVSSSVLPMLAMHSDAAPGSETVATQSVSVQTLDSLALPLLGPDARLFIKIDTQGYEDRVLDGATALLDRARGVQLEVSLVPLYEGQATREALMSRMEAAGFSLWSIWPGFFDPTSGRLLQFDATFFREPGTR
ncbi:MAG TPA: FkbM family methyltransferase [Arenimonas sp.]|uniref:FkbM family methyltransferase n=1 Tax=Arenimonas sp. TaxID=1872635 RepID=UPI002D7F8A6F|nr:FkbM family methyltransferase [Arenimonas sp.]HEU0153892.1 FkbM family methyltransferase [Arenimonas sp.]